jgi:carbon-monoxide dehydrogenase medium subunit
MLSNRGARVLAGGQTLIPQLSARQEEATVLVDLSAIAGLDQLTIEAGAANRGVLRVGAMARQLTVERSILTHRHCPLLATALRYVGHVAIRSRGTVVGSIVQSEPTAELPAVFLALDGELELIGPDGPRIVPAEAIQPGRGWLGRSELVVAARFPIDRTQVGFGELTTRYNDLPLATVATVIEKTDSAPTIVVAVEGRRERICLAALDADLSATLMGAGLDIHWVTALVALTDRALTEARRR